jgi:hypothetical protein
MESLAKRGDRWICGLARRDRQPRGQRSAVVPIELQSSESLCDVITAATSVHQGGAEMVEPVSVSRPCSDRDRLSAVRVGNRHRRRVSVLRGGLAKQRRVQSRRVPKQ